MWDFLKQLGRGLLVAWEVINFFLREVVGWALIALGLTLLFFVWSWLSKNFVIQAAALTVPAVVLFRGGIHLLKVSVAGRLALQARERLENKEKADRVV